MNKNNGMARSQSVWPGWVLFIGLSLTGTLVGASQLPGAALATAHPIATEVGANILRRGGNAFDAAVAISATLAVVEPMGSGLGGGGFWLLHRSADDFDVMIDGRERAPLAAHRDMYLDDRGEPIKGLSVNGPLAAGIPGLPAALEHISRKYGRLSLRQSLQAAIELARTGVPVSERYRRLAKLRQSKLSPAAARVFLKDGEIPPLGHRLVQTDLAGTLEQLASDGARAFYHGEYARKLVQGVASAGGIWTLKDLSEYQIVERVPIVFNYGDARVISASLPSSGGIVLSQALNMLAGFDLKTMLKAQRVHTLVEVMRRAYHQRMLYLGDSDFVAVDVPHLIDRGYARQMARDIGEEASANLGEKETSPSAGQDTTHFSIIDFDGNRVAATLSINYAFGSGFMVPGTGVVLNNEMDDFVAKLGIPNLYGLVGTEANAIAPGKRPLSSMTPSFIETPDRLVVLGTPGGSRIISMLLLASLEVISNRGEPEDWVQLRRFHHQYRPNTIIHESGAFSPELQAELVFRGHRLQQHESGYGNMQIVEWDKRKKILRAASDPRGEGKAEVLPAIRSGK